MTESMYTAYEKGFHSICKHHVHDSVADPRDLQDCFSGQRVQQTVSATAVCKTGLLKTLYERVSASITITTCSGI